MCLEPYKREENLMSSNNQKDILRYFIRESLLAERRFYRYNPAMTADRSPRGPRLFGVENPQSIEQVGLVHSLATPAYRTLFGGGVDDQGNPIEGRGLFGLVTGLAGGVIRILGGVFNTIGNLAGTVSSGITRDISSGSPRRYTRNIAGGSRSVRENFDGSQNTGDVRDFLERVRQDVDQLVSDYLAIKNQPDINSLNDAIANSFLDYTETPPVVPSAESLLEDAMLQSPDPRLQNLSGEQQSRLVQDVENYTVENVSREMRRTFLDILSQLKDQAGLAGGASLAGDSEALSLFDSIFDRAYSDISFS